jgi:hypothetical protein
LPFEPEESRESGKTDAGARRHTKEKMRRAESLFYVGEISQAAPALVALDAANPCRDEPVRSDVSTHHNPEIAGPG